MLTTSTMQDLGEFLTKDVPPTTTPDRLVIRFNTETHTILPNTPRARNPLKGATLLHYKESIRKTPTGGRYLAKRMTIRTKDGRRWVGQVKNGTDVVRLRPEPPTTST